MSSKRKIIIIISLFIVMFVIIKLFLGGTYLYHFWEELIPEIITLLFVSLVMMIIPFLFKVFNKRKIKFATGKKICFFNSLILYIVFSIPNILTILKGCGNRDLFTVDPLFLSKTLLIIYFVISLIYYFINMLIFVENKK